MKKIQKNLPPKSESGDEDDHADSFILSDQPLQKQMLFEGSYRSKFETSFLSSLQSW